MRKAGRMALGRMALGRKLLVRRVVRAAVRIAPAASKAEDSGQARTVLAADTVRAAAARVDTT